MVKLFVHIFKHRSNLFTFDHFSFEQFVCLIKCTIPTKNFNFGQLKTLGINTTF